MLVLLLALLLQEASDSAPVASRSWTIYLDDKPHSQLLRAELERDWTKPRADVQPPAESLAILAETNRRRDAVLRVVRLMHYQQAPLEFRRLPSYPAIRYGYYGHATVFDERAFTDSGRPLTVVETIIANTGKDLASWRRACERERRQAEEAHVERVCKWLRSMGEKFEPPVAEDTAPWEFYWFEAMQVRYANYDGYPEYVAPVPPPSPLRKFPWE